MRLFSIILIITAGIQAYGQTRIQGHISDGQAPIHLGNIYLKGSFDGATADESGNFEFVTSESGKQTLIATFVGFKPFEKVIDLNGEAINLQIILKEEINEINAITISAGAFAASDESRRTIFRAVDIATTAGATADIAGALNTLPGTQKVGESGRLFVRGGDGGETRTFIDGMLVLDAYSPSAPNTPSRGRFLPFMFKGISFATGAYSAEYGQALSSTLALDSKDESEKTRTDIGLLSVGGDVTHTQAWKGGSAAAKVQYTNLRPYVGLIDQEIDWKKAPVSTEGIAAFRQRTGKGMLKVFGNFSRSEMSLRRPDIDDEALSHVYTLDNDFRYLNGTYKGPFNERWVFRSGISYTHLKNQSTTDDRKMHDRERGLHAKAVIDGSISDRVEIKAGVEAIRREYSSQLGLVTNSPASFQFTETVSSTFAETDVFVSNNLVARAGVRAEYNSLLRQASLDPRISMALRTGASGQVSLAYGRFRQSPRNQYLKINPHLLNEKADHFILSYQLMEDRKTLRVEGYYKLYDNLIRFANANSLAPNNLGSGYARGVELFWRDRGWVKNLDYWMSYSFLDTEREYLHFPYRSVPAFASRHNFSVVAKYFVTKMKSQLGATFSLATGRRYHDPNETQFNSGITPAYHDLSFNWSYLPKPWLIVYASCTNLTGRENIFGYEFSQLPDDNGYYRSRPIRQPAPRFLFLGIFITLSKDKSVSQLPAL